MVALLIGALIGAEREYKNKSAGFRTIILICVGSTLFTIFSIEIGGLNPDRIAANIITGIGFIGAGAIFRFENRVTGLTTATTIWASAALGMGIGAGYFAFSLIAALLVLIVLYAFIWLQNIIDKAHHIRRYKIVNVFQEHSIDKYDELFIKFNLKAEREKKHLIGNQISGIWNATGSEENHKLFLKELLKDKEIKELEF